MLLHYSPGGQAIQKMMEIEADLIFCVISVHPVLKTAACSPEVEYKIQKLSRTARFRQDLIYTPRNCGQRATLLHRFPDIFENALGMEVAPLDEFRLSGIPIPQSRSPNLKIVQKLPA
jgi:hypothetical protein